MTQNEISQELGISPPHVTYYLKKMLKMGIIEEIHVKEGIVYPFKEDTDYTIELKRVKSEKFYRRREDIITEHDINKVLIVHKHSLFDAKIIEAYIDYIPEIRPGFKKSKSVRYKLDQFIDTILELTKPPFAY